MKKPTRGFSSLLIILIVIILCVGGYYLYKQHTSQPVQNLSATTTPTTASSTVSSKKPTQDPEVEAYLASGFDSCAGICDATLFIGTTYKSANASYTLHLDNVTRTATDAVANITVSTDKGTIATTTAVSQIIHVPSSKGAVNILLCGIGQDVKVPTKDGWSTDFMLTTGVEQPECPDLDG